MNLGMSEYESPPRERPRLYLEADFVGGWVSWVLASRSDAEKNCSEFGNEAASSLADVVATLGQVGQCLENAQVVPLSPGRNDQQEFCIAETSDILGELADLIFYVGPVV